MMGIFVLGINGWQVELQNQIIAFPFIILDLFWMAGVIKNDTSVFKGLRSTLWNLMTRPMWLLVGSCWALIVAAINLSIFSVKQTGYFQILIGTITTLTLLETILWFFAVFIAFSLWEKLPSGKPQVSPGQEPNAMSVSPPTASDTNLEALAEADVVIDTNTGSLSPQVETDLAAEFSDKTETSRTVEDIEEEALNSTAKPESDLGEKDESNLEMPPKLGHESASENSTPAIMAPRGADLVLERVRRDSVWLALFSLLPPLSLGAVFVGWQGLKNDKYLSTRSLLAFSMGLFFMISFLYSMFATLLPSTYEVFLPQPAELEKLFDLEGNSTLIDSTFASSALFLDPDGLRKRLGAVASETWESDCLIGYMMAKKGYLAPAIEKFQKAIEFDPPQGEFYRMFQQKSEKKAPTSLYLSSFRWWV